MNNKRIKLKKAYSRQKKIIRRFIHSIDKDKENKIYLNSRKYSDSELYIVNNIDYNKEGNNNNIFIKKDNYKTNYSRSEELSSLTLEDNSKSKEMNLDMNIKINDENKKGKNDKIIQKLKSHAINDNKLKFNLLPDNNRKGTNNLNIKKELNKSSDFLLANETKKIKPYFSVIKNFYIDNGKKQKKQNNISRKHKGKNSIIPSNNIKNDYCSICLGGIQEKYTLICGDYFCRECLYERIKSILKCIADFDKIKCPICNEPIEENTLKRLLNDNDFNFYQKIKMRIEGLKNKNLFPCPYPDCEGFANRTTEHKNSIYVCQNNHYFCEKCREVVDKKNLNPKYKHLCENKYPLTFKYFNMKKKRNIIKKCPNCSCWVQKEQNSCNNVICPNIWCNLEFCWICKSPYDDYHYKNPFSMCFGLSSIDSQNYFTKDKRIRLFRCIIIILIIIFILFPFCIAFFSLIEILTYVFGFLIEKSGLRNVRLKSKFTHKIFYKIFFLFYVLISIGLIPIGYFSIVLIIVVIPFICLFKKMKNNDDDFD